MTNDINGQSYIQGVHDVLSILRYEIDNLTRASREQGALDSGTTAIRALEATRLYNKVAKFKSVRESENIL